MEIPGVEIKGSNSNRRAGAGTKRVRRFARASLVQFRQRSHGARHTAFPPDGCCSVFAGSSRGSARVVIRAICMGGFLHRSWARWLGMIAAVVNLLLVVSVIAQGEAVTQAIPWLIVPVILISYLCFRFRASAS